MNRRELLKVGFGIAAASFVGTTRKADAITVWPSPGRPDILLVLWDGVGYYKIASLLTQGLLPNLSGLITAGGVFQPMWCSSATRTWPTWTQVFTGQADDQSGVYGNKQFDPELPGLMVKDNAPSHQVFHNFLGFLQPVPRSHGLWHQLQSLSYRVGLTGSKTLWSTSLELTPFVDMMEELDFHSCHYPTPGDDGDLYLDFQVLDALEFMDQPGKWCLTVHMDPDYYGHIGGPDSARYKEEIVRCDSALGELLARCDMSETVVCVLTDHGFDPQSSGPPWVHFNAPDGSMMIYGMPVERTERATSLDFFPTFTRFIETEPYLSHPKKRGRSLLVG